MKTSFSKTTKNWFYCYLLNSTTRNTRRCL